MLNKLTNVLSLIVILLLPINYLLAEEWIEYKYPELGFSVSSPLKLRIEDKKKEGGLVVSDYGEDELELSVAFIIKDVEDLKGKTDQEIIQFLIDDHKSTTKINSQNKLDKFNNAIEVIGSIDDEIFSLTWFIIEKEGLFQISVNGLNKSAVTEKIGKKFAESFKLLNTSGKS